MATNLAKLELYSADERERSRPRTRKAARRRISDCYATIFSPRGEIAAKFRDISIQGCAVSYSIGELRLGQFIQIALNDLKPVSGIVRWVGEGSCGIEFLAPISWDIAAMEFEDA
jgi:hypothetical protein